MTRARCAAQLPFHVHRPLRFSYFSLDHARLSKISPRGGPTAGGTPLTLSGVHLTSRGGLRARFGAFGLADVNATQVDELRVRLNAPTFADTALGAAPNATRPYVTTDVQLTINDDDRAMLQAAVPYTYFATDALVISSFYPRAGPAAGGTEVTVRGAGFRDLGGIACAFGAATPTRAILSRALHSVIDGAPDADDLFDMVQCRAPPLQAALGLHPKGSLRGYERVDVGVRITLNDDELGEPCATSNYTYYRL